MSKQLKDYLHLYLGCDIELTLPFDSENPAKETLKGVEGLTVILLQGGRVGIEDIKPILRPISDMTEEEFIEVESQKGNEDIYIAKGHGTDPHKVRRFLITQNAAKIKVLLSKHFDVFELIEAGLAIDKTTLTHG